MVTSNPESETTKIEEAPALNKMTLTEHNGGAQAQDISRDNLASYATLYKIFQVSGLCLVFLVFYWIQSFRGGFGFGEAKIIFNWHPLFMTIGFIYLFANAILHYRSFRNSSKRNLKNQHAIIHGVIIVLVSLGGWASYASHIYANPPIPNFYTLHSWLGILTILMFFSQFVSGIISFLYPGIAAEYRAAIMPYHFFFGVFNFALAVVTSVLGFGEKLIFGLAKEYKDFPNEGLLGNFLGVLFVIYAGLVVYMVTKPEYKRQPKPEDGVLLDRSPE